MQLLEWPAQIGAGSGRGVASERVGPGLATDVDVLTTGVGQGDQLAAGLGGDGDEALVFELADGRVDRARAGCPAPAGAVADRLHQLVAVHRLLGEQQQDGGADVTARCSSPPAVTAASTHAVDGGGSGSVWAAVMVVAELPVSAFSDR